MSVKSEVYTIKWLGFNERRNYDRIFGHLQMNDGRDYVFWGRRGKKIDFKRHTNPVYVSSAIHENKKKGYKQIEPSHYEMICPKFFENLEIWLTAYILQED